MANEAAVMENSGGQAAIKPEILSLRTQLVSQGHTRVLLAETDNSTFRIHCYGPKSGENGLHAHIDEDHVFVVLQGEAQFYDLDGALPVLKKHQALMLPKGCFYSFSNDGDEPLVMLRFGAMEKNWKGDRLDPKGKPIPGRGQAHGSAPTIMIDNAYLRIVTAARLRTQLMSAAQAATWRGSTPRARKQRVRIGGGAAAVECRAMSATSSPGGARSFSHSTASSFDPMRPVMKL